MESGNNNRFDGAGWEAHISQWKEDAAASDSLSESDPTASSQKTLSDPASRRRFLRTTVAAGAVVTGVVAAGGVVYAAKGPQILASLAAGNSVPSGHCVHIVEGVKGSTNNPNQHIQVSTTDFQTYIGSISGSTFTISHGVGVLVDKNGHSPNFAVCITGAAYKGGGTNTVSLTVNPAVTDEYPTGSCLYISQTHGTC